MAMKYNLNVTVTDDDSLEVKMENPGGLSSWAIIGILEKLKTELVLSMPGPEDVNKEEADAS